MAEPFFRPERERVNYVLALALLAVIVTMVALSVSHSKPTPHYLGWPPFMSGPR